MVQVVWTKTALEDLQEIGGFIYTDSPAAAVDLVNTIRQKTKNLEKYPRIGRMVPEKEDPSLRELLYKSYRTVYEILEDRVEILFVMHQSQILRL